MIYILSDIHGNLRRFGSVMAQIRLQPEDTLYVLGDVIDRHPHGIQILRKLMAMPNVKMLLGNHEYMMLRALGCPYDDNFDDGRALAHWYRNGGQVTHDYLKRIRKCMRREIVDYLLALPLEMDVKMHGVTYKLVHGAPAGDYDHDPRYHNPVHFAVWKRLDLEYAKEKDCVLIFGHTSTKHYQDNVPMEIWMGENLIGIDCGSGYPETGPDSRYGRLACLRLDDGTVFYSREGS